MAKTKRKNNKTKIEQNTMTCEIISIVFVAISIFFLISMWTDKGGALGSMIKNLFLGIFSISACRQQKRPPFRAAFCRLFQL